MEEIKRNEELKQILEGLQKALELYNGINPEEKLELVKQVEKKDVSSIFVCVYNSKCVGLFKKINWSSTIYQWTKYHSPEYNAGSIYVGIDSNYIGMKSTHEDMFSRNSWQEVGKKVVVDGKSYVANCNMQNGMSFDDMRLIMYSAGQIGPYEIGKATSQEMLEVLKYASSYYQLDQSVQNKRTR